MAIVRITGGPDTSSKSHRLGDMPFVIGRAQSCDLPIEDKLASRKHCRIVPANGGFSVEDLGSRNGTLLNDKPLESNTPLTTGDVIRIGEVQITFDAEGAVSHTGEQSAPGAAGLVQTNSGEPPFGAPGTLFELRFSGRCGTFNRTLDSPVTTVGRSEEADLQIQEPLASRIHCQFEVKSTGVKVVDLESRNGTQVNGATVNQKFLQRHDRIQIGESIIIIGSRLPPTTSELVGGIGSEARKPTVSEADNLRSPARLDTPAPTGAPVLVWTDDGQQNRVQMGSDRMVIGRSEKVDVTIKEQLASREHVTVRRLSNGSFEVEDLGSRNGTRLNGRDLRGKIELVSGDVIQIGSVSLRFEVPGQSPAPSAAATGSDARVPSSGPTAARKSSGMHPAAAMAEGGGGPRRRRRRASRSGGSDDGTVGMIIGVVVVVLAVVGLAIALSGGSGNGSRTADDDDGVPDDINIHPVNRTNRNGRTGNGASRNNATRNNAARNNGSNGSNGSSANNGSNSGPSSNNDRPPANNDRPPANNGGNAPPTDELETWANRPGLSSFEKQIREQYVERFYQVESMLDDARYGDAVRAMKTFIRDVEGRPGADASVDRADEVVKDAERLALGDWRQNFAEKVNSTPAGERQAKWGEDLQHRFAGIPQIEKEAADLGVTIGSD